MEDMRARMDFDDVAWEKSEADFEAWKAATLRDKPTMRQVGWLIKKYRMGEPDEMQATILGGFNLVYRLKFKDGGVAIARFPMPGVVRFPEEKIRNEVATMRYVQEHTTIPVPFVLHHGTSDESPEGLGPFIIMEWIEHESDLFDILNTPDLPDDSRPLLNSKLPLQRVEHIYAQIADVLLQLSRLKLSQIGALNQLNEDTWVADRRPLSLQMNDLVDRGSLSPDRLITSPFETSSAYFEAMSLQMMRHFILQPHNCMWTYQEGCRRFLARYLFRKLVKDGRLPARTSANTGPFPLFFDDMRPGNILLSKSDRIVGIVDWEFVYAGPQGFTSSAPWWLLLDQPENWPEDRGSWLDAYKSQLDVFLRCLERQEEEALDHGRMTEDERLSTGMRRSLETGDFWLYYMVRRPWAFDAIYWREIDKKFFGDAEDVFEKRKKLLDPDILAQMEALITDKAEHHNRMRADRTTCCEKWIRPPVYEKLEELMHDDHSQGLAYNSSGCSASRTTSNGNGMAALDAKTRVDIIEGNLHELKI